MKHQIKHLYTGAVLFECDVPDDIPVEQVTCYALEKANLSGADLSGVNLVGANLSGFLLVGDRPIFQIGPIGSRCDYLTGYLTDNGVMIQAGCFFGTLNEFNDKLSETHGNNIHGAEYRAAIELIRVHAEMWTPKE